MPEIYIPELRTTKWLGDGALLPVDKKSSRKHIELVELFGQRNEEELGFDFPLGIGKEPTKGDFIVRQDAVATVQPVRVVIFEHLSNRWPLPWIGIHPYEWGEGAFPRTRGNCGNATRGRSRSGTTRQWQRSRSRRKCGGRGS